MSNITLKCGNKIYDGWSEISITKDMTSLADTFKFSIYKGVDVQIKEGDFVQVLKDDKVFLTGYIDVYEISIERERSPLTLSGRSKSSDVIDCNIETLKQYNQLPPLQIIRDIIGNFDITVTSDVENLGLETFDTKVGETFFNAINRLCKQANIIPISDANGNIRLTKNNKKHSGITLRDTDLTSIKYTSDFSKRFKTYRYKKESVIADVKDHVEVDNEVKRYRPFVDTNTENKSNADMAKWKKNNDKANSQQLDITIYDWNLEINQLVTIDSELIKNDFLIKEITYERSKNGTISKLTLVEKDLFDV